VQSRIENRISCIDRRQRAGELLDGGGVDDDDRARLGIRQQLL
jgi:hypothetical protein